MSDNRGVPLVSLDIFSATQHSYLRDFAVNQTELYKKGSLHPIGSELLDM